jgi:GT2 family glycosyltransferase
MSSKDKNIEAYPDLLRVRVGIVTRNRAGILPLAIKSALDQDYPSIEVHVIDDASSDETSTIRDRFPQITWQRNDTPRGCIEARNQIMSEPGADLFVSLDDDSWFLERDAINIGLRTMRETGAAAIAYDILDDRARQQHKRTTPKQVHTFIGCGHMVDVRRAHALGLYQPMPGAYGGEEKDLCLRLLDNGGKVLFLEGVHVWHDKTMSSRDVGGQHRSGICNDLVSSWTRCPLAFLPGLMVLKPLRHLEFACRFATRRRDRMDRFEQSVRDASGRFVFVAPALLGILDAFQLLPQIGAERNAVSVRTWNEFRRLTRNPPQCTPSTLHPDPELVEQSSGPGWTSVPSEFGRKRIGAIVAAFDRDEQTLDTLARLKNCNPPPDEVWVHVDGGKNDLARAVRESHLDVHVLVSDANIGPGGARNRLLDSCECPLVASFDDDSFPLDADYFARIRRLAALWPDTAVFTGELCTPGLIPRPAEPFGYWTGSFLGGACVYNRPAFDDKERYVPLPVAYGMEEMDLGIRLSASKQPIMHTPWLRVYHDNDSHKHQSAAITAASLANLALLAFLRYPITAWPLGLMQVASRVFWLVQNNRIKGMLNGFRSIPSVIFKNRAERKPVKMADLMRFFSLRRNISKFSLGINDQSV